MDDKLKGLRQLEEIVETLRGPGGCPWDRQQTLKSLCRNFLEEACEVIDAVEEAPEKEVTASENVCEELGDLLMNIFLAARIAEETGGFDLAMVSQRICEKLVRRHPHVFGAESIDNVEGVLSRWESLKREEKPASGNKSLLERVPKSLPPLASAYELGRRAAKVGFDWSDSRGVVEKVREELGEVEECLKRENSANELKQELGDLLFAVVNLCRKLDVLPGEALGETNRKFRRRFRHIEEHLGTGASDSKRPLSLEEMEELWKEAKKFE